MGELPGQADTSESDEDEVTLEMIDVNVGADECAMLLVGETFQITNRWGTTTLQVSGIIEPSREIP